MRRSSAAFASRAALLATSALLVQGCSSERAPPSYQRTIATMTSRIEQQRTTGDATFKGLSIALVDGQRVVWARGFGKASVQPDVDADADTIYEIGSVSKTFAAATIMQLVEEGRMGLDDPLVKHVPSFSIHQAFPASSPITLRSILTHHSGIPGDIFNGGFTEGGYFDYDTWLLDYLATEYTAAPVGQVLAYSNAGFALLRRAIDHATPEGFDARSLALFDSMGMRNTSYYLDGRIPRNRLSKSYDANGEAPLLYGNMSTAGTMRSSVMDMTKYIRTLLAGGVASGGRILKQSSLDEMFTRQNRNAPLDFDSGIGLSWFTGPDDYYAGRRIEHEGATPVMHSMVKILLDHQLGVVVLSNTMTAAVGKFAQETLELALEEKTGLTPPPAPTPACSPPDATWTDARLAALAGTFIASDEYMGFATRVFTAAPGGLSIDGGTETWIPRQNGSFTREGTCPDAMKTQLFFQTLDGRSVLSVAVGGQRVLFAERFDPGPMPDKWRARVGDYVATNVPAGGHYWPATDSVNLTIDPDGILRLRGGFRADAPLRIIDETRAVTGGIGRNRGESVQALTIDGVEQIQVWGYRYRKKPT